MARPDRLVLLSVDAEKLQCQGAHLMRHLRRHEREAAGHEHLTTKHNTKFGWLMISTVRRDNRLITRLYLPHEQDE